MYFCPSCKILLLPDSGVLKCKLCGFTDDSKIKVKEKLEKERKVEIIDEANEHIGDDLLPIVCWNCGSTGVYFWMVQMRRADEPPTRFYKCKKCKKVWRSGK
jgi:transcription factor S